MLLLLAGPLFTLTLYQRSLYHSHQAAKDARTDNLTGLGNHRAYQAALRGVIADAQREGTEFSLCIVDVDDFKRINDTYGHQVGDDVLVALAEILRNAPEGEAFRLAGLKWSGHTDLLAHLTGAKRVAMMFYSERLVVVLATVHIPLAEVPEALTKERVQATIALTADSVARFTKVPPRIAVAGLNPHAGEHGLFGTEEDRVIAPAIAECRTRGIDVSGPYPADTVFLRATRGEFDVVIACYHDQGLIPVKLLAFGQAVNVTLGLPIVRTSVDHGTAFDIAGKGVADPESMIASVLLAARLARQS